MALANANPAGGDGGARQVQFQQQRPASNSQNPTNLQVRRLVRDFGLPLHVAGVVAEHAYRVEAMR